MARGYNQVTVFSPISVVLKKQHVSIDGLAFKAGQHVKVAWDGQDGYIDDLFVFHLRGNNLGAQALVVGWAFSSKGETVLRFDRKKIPTGDYHLEVSSKYVDGANTGEFSIGNKRIPTPTPLPGKGVMSK